MFTVNNLWETGKEQDVLSESLFGKVNLISYKKKENSEKKVESGDVLNLKRKSSLRERGRKKKKGKYNFTDENRVKSSTGLDEAKFKQIPYMDAVVNDKTSSIHKADMCCIDKEKGKEEEVDIIDEKTKFKEEGLHTTKEKSLKRKTSLKDGGLEKKKGKYAVKAGSNETDLNNYNTASTAGVVRNVSSSTTELHRRAGKCYIAIELEREMKKKKEERTNQTEVLVIEDLSKPQINFTDDKHVCFDGNEEDSHTLLNGRNDTELANSKGNKKRKKRKKKDTRTEIIVTENNITPCNDDNKTIHVSSDGHEKENHQLPNENFTDLIKSEVDKKTKKKIKKRKKRGAVESDTNFSTPTHPVENQNINTVNNVNSKPAPPQVDNNVPTLTAQTQTSQWKSTLKYNKFQRKIMEKLKGGQFRWINEKLYSCKSSDAVDMFSTDPKLFHIYHSGFHSQVQQWPQNPVDVIIEYIKARDDQLVIADFGCGDAKLSKSVPNKVHAFDLVAVNDHVTACDMKKVPLARNSVHIAVFCLSLMGTNLVDFLVEAHRVIKTDGILKIGEVKSRFEDIDKFIQGVSSLGFSLIERDDSNKMFILLEFQKIEKLPSKRTANIKLNPCIYKRR